ncbi:NCS2 family permease [Deferribacterales bacterium Es71-Z0220]|uniref:NCS2 family permease n=1 Tax=Deferrivibrio essentukiensis TaxID=2880922 RepID=UPI001F62157E|nr:NCS2 family permease [Deferrivibrio essentukiensis]MCB4204651.1 NCS2 family permease [Deferrivibrio essentukiensis]
MLEKFFKLKENNTDVKTEIIAGITTFMTMAYIIFVNPAILSKTGMDFGAVMMATVLASGFTSILMGLLVNYPFALAPGMGLNAYFTYTVVMQMGYPWQTALGAVFISGVIFLALTFARIRQIIVYAIPENIKIATAGGIGLFITLIGMEESKIIIDNPATLVSLGDIMSPVPLMTLLGVIIIGALMARKVKGSILIGMLIIWVIGLIFGLSTFKGIVGTPPDISPVFLQLDIRGALDIGIFGIIFAFLFVDLFDTTGTLVGIAKQGGFIKENNEFPRVNRALTVDSIGTVAGSMLGTSTVTTYIESASGIAAGGKTGLTAVVTGILFLLSMFISPLAESIPVFATAPALIIVGVLMLKSVTTIDWNDFTESLPAFIVIVSMPFTYSIATGISLGFIFYPIIKLLAGRHKEVSIPVWILAILFILRFIYLGGN